MFTVQVPSSEHALLNPSGGGEQSWRLGHLRVCCLLCLQVEHSEFCDGLRMPDMDHLICPSFCGFVLVG